MARQLGRRRKTRLQRQLLGARGQFVLRGLRANRWNVVKTAKALGVQRSYLYHLIGQTPGLRQQLRQARAARRKERRAAHG